MIKYIAGYAWQAGSYAERETIGLIGAETLLDARKAARFYALETHGERGAYRLFKLCRPPHGEPFYTFIIGGARENGEWVEKAVC